MGSLAIAQPEIDPVTGLPIDPVTGQPIQQQPGPAQPAFNSIYGSPQNAVLPNTIADPNAPMQNRYTQNQNIIGARGDQINNEALYNMGYYGSLVPGYQSQMDQQLDSLKNQPGYSPDQQAKIGVDYGQFQTTPGEYSAMAGDPAFAQKKAEQGTAGEGAMLNAYGENLSGEVGNYGKGVEGATDQYGNAITDATGKYGAGVGGAVGGLKSGLEGAQNWDTLNGAVNSKGLDFDPNGTEKQLTDQDVQSIKTAAGTRIGNQYRSAEDTLERQAAEAGNTSPMALAAARARLMTQEAADQGDAEANADIGARQAQYQRAAGIEGQRLGSEQTKSGMRATAGTTEEAAAQAAAGLAGTSDIAAQENIGAAGMAGANNVGQARIQSAKDVGAAGIDAANRYGTTSIATQADIGAKNAAAAQTADTAATSRAGTAANMRYNQGTGTAAANSQGAQTIGNADIAGKGALRSGIQGQEGFAQTGGNQAAGQQNTAYGTMTNGLNGSAAAQGQFINGKPSFGDDLAGGFAKAVTGLIGPAASGGLKGGVAKGAIIHGTEIHRIAESGPEIVMPLGGRYGGGKIVTSPTIAKLTDEAVIPLNNKAGNHTNPSLLEGHLAPPHVNGMRYQRYKQYSNPAF